MTRPAIRPWCAVAQYPGLRRFRVGTVTMPAEARHDEIMAGLRDHALTILPPGFTIIRPQAGSLFFQPEPEQVPA
jgi:hypothetical protein